jgi:uncharacterized membrane protein YcaP (DUF421 family)
MGSRCRLLIMNKYDIEITDFARIFTGNTPPMFFIEIILRAIIVYIILLGAMRLMGKRLASRLNRNELAAISTLAAAVGIPLLTPDRGVLPGVIIALVVVLVQRTIAHLSFKYQPFERATQGAISVLVTDGQLQLKAMKSSRISREQLFSQLRLKKIRHLGEVKRMYMEASGAFTIIQAKDPKPGLSVIPAFDTAFLDEQVRNKEVIVCSYCGCADDIPADQPCAECGKVKKEAAIQ